MALGKNRDGDKGRGMTKEKSLCKSYCVDFLLPSLNGVEQMIFYYYF